VLTITRAAWFLLCDGLATITVTAILFARTELHMSSTSLIILAAIVPLSGIVGNIVSVLIPVSTL
jgi:UMF1 family MFS transporter